MPVDAIGGALSVPSPTSNPRSVISQEDFIRLFVAQLQFQDPLEPLDNREFLTQLASFSSLEQAKQTSEGVDNLLSMNSSAQALTLLERAVQVQAASGPGTGTVTAVKFTASGPELTVRLANGTDLTGIKLAQVTLVSPIATTTTR